MDEEDEAPEVLTCIGCAQVDVDELDEFGQCVDCSPVLDAPIPVCRSCKAEEGPYDGLCGECLMADVYVIDGHVDADGDEPW